MFSSAGSILGTAEVNVDMWLIGALMTALPDRLEPRVLPWRAAAGDRQARVFGGR